MTKRLRSDDLFAQLGEELLFLQEDGADAGSSLAFVRVNGHHCVLIAARGVDTAIDAIGFDRCLELSTTALTSDEFPFSAKIWHFDGVADGVRFIRALESIENVQDWVVQRLAFRVGQQYHVEGESYAQG